MAGVVNEGRHDAPVISSDAGDEDGIIGCTGGIVATGIVAKIGRPEVTICGHGTAPIAVGDPGGSNALTRLIDRRANRGDQAIEVGFNQIATRFGT